MSGSATTLNTGIPQGCDISQLQFMLLIHNCAIKSGTTVVGLINDNGNVAYRDTAEHIADRSTDNNQACHVDKK